MSEALETSTAIVATGYAPATPRQRLWNWLTRKDHRPESVILEEAAHHCRDSLEGKLLGKLLELRNTSWVYSDACSTIDGKGDGYIFGGKDGLVIVRDKGCFEITMNGVQFLCFKGQFITGNADCTVLRLLFGELYLSPYHKWASLERPFKLTQQDKCVIGVEATAMDMYKRASAAHDAQKRRAIEQDAREALGLGGSDV